MKGYVEKWLPDQKKSKRKTCENMKVSMTLEHIVLETSQQRIPRAKKKWRAEYGWNSKLCKQMGKTMSAIHNLMRWDSPVRGCEIGRWPSAAPKLALWVGFYPLPKLLWSRIPQKTQSKQKHGFIGIEKKRKEKKGERKKKKERERNYNGKRPTVGMWLRQAMAIF